jgi:hypothetical protein
MAIWRWPTGPFEDVLSTGSRHLTTPLPGTLHDPKFVHSGI